MATSRHVLGKEALRRLLAQLPKTVKTKLQAGMTAEANELATLMKSRINDKTGNLSASIKVEPFTRGGIGAIIVAGGPLTTKPVRDGQSQLYDYAWAVELGAQHMLAVPYFYPSFRQRKSSIKRRASKAVREAVAEAK